MKETQESLIKAALKVLKAGIITLLDKEPMFAQVLMNLQYKAANVGTCAVDGKYFLYDPKFLGTRTITDRLFIIAHEALHMIFLHPFQMRDMLKLDPMFDCKLANQAMDYVINALLLFLDWRLPSDALYDSRFTKDMEWLQVYRMLEKERENGDSSGKQSGEGSGKPDDQLSGDSSDDSNGNSEGTSGENQNEQTEGESDEESGEESGGESGDEKSNEIPSGCEDNPNGGVIPAQDDIENETEQKQKISQATEILAKAGKLGGELQRKIEDVLDVLESPWQILQDCIERITIAQASYRKPSRRRKQSNIIFPGIERDFEIENGVIAFDVSGSVNSKMLNHFWKHGTNILQEYSGNVYILFCDSELPEENISEFECSNISDDPPNFDGGGGTAFSPVFDWIETNDICPEFLIYFTDMNTSDWDEIKETDYPVYWLVWNERWNEDKTPFGITIDISNERY